MVQFIYFHVIINYLLVTFSHYIYIMMEPNQKQRDIVLSILQDFDLNNQPRDFIKAVATFLDLEQPKIYQPNILAEKIVHLYDHYKGQYDIYLSQLKFKQLNTDAKDFLWTVFKKYQQKLNQRKFVMGQSKPMGIREHMNQPINSNTNQSMSMNMVNMFMDVPNLQTVQEIQIFQRKMFDLYKNFLPQVLNSIPMPLSSGPNQMYRGNPYQQYGMSGVGGLTGMAGMSNMSNMQGLGMSGLAGHSNISGGMPGLSSSGLVNNSNMNNPSSMTSLSGYSNKQDYFQPTYQNRYYFENNKQIGGYVPNQQSQKTIPTDYRNHPMHMNSLGFNYCGDRFVPDQFRNSKHSDMMLNSRMNPTMDEFQRRQKQKNFGSVEDRRYDNPYQNYNLNQYSQQYNEKKNLKNSERERQALCTKQFASQQPRKMHKKDEQQQLNSEQQQQKKKSFKLNCTCVKQEQICYYCRCSNLDPFNEVYEVLLMQRITPQNNKITYTVSKKWLQKISKSSDRMDIEIRCIKMDKMSSDQICWPEKYSIKVDDQFVQNYTSENTSIKKRKQSSFVLIKSLGDDRLKQQTVNIGIECKFVQQIDKPQICDYTLGIFIIMKHTYQKMYEKIVSKMSEKNISTFINKKQQGNDERQEQLVLQTHEPSIRKLIKIPIRGKNCSHPECFDLEVFLSMLAIQHNRQWRCPICAKDAKELVIDTELKTILADISKMVKQPDEIIFYSDGSHDIRYKEEGQQKEKQSDSNEAEG